MMISGLGLILLGVYFHLYSETIEKMGVTGIVISACCVAIGMIMSLPTKMYLTFVLVAREQDQQEEAKRQGKHKVEGSFKQDNAQSPAPNESQLKDMNNSRLG